MRPARPSGDEASPGDRGGDAPAQPAERSPLQASYGKPSAWAIAFLVIACGWALLALALLIISWL